MLSRSCNRLDEKADTAIYCRVGNAKRAPVRSIEQSDPASALREKRGRGVLQWGDTADMPTEFV
jgi:hypothetical protein